MDVEYDWWEWLLTLCRHRCPWRRTLLLLTELVLMPLMMLVQMLMLLLKCRYWYADADICDAEIIIIVGGTLVVVQELLLSVAIADR
jgi:hypothetical protein